MTSSGSQGGVEPGDLLKIADELYAHDVGDFTAARDALVKQLKADRALALRVKALRRPSLAAWAVNLLVRSDRSHIEEVLGMAQALRSAQAAADGEELRALTRQRRQLIAALTARTRSLAAQAGHRLTESVAEQVENTLTAALLDAEAGRAVGSGMLVSGLRATGVDPIDVASAVGVPEALGYQPASPPVRGAAGARDRAGSAGEAAPSRLRAVPPSRPDPEAVAAELVQRKSAQVTAATAALTECERGEGSARAAETEARGAEARKQAEALQVQADIEELTRRLAELEAQAERIDAELAPLNEQAARAADRAASASDATARAREALASAEAELVEAEGALARLRGTRHASAYRNPGAIHRA